MCHVPFGGLTHTLHDLVQCLFTSFLQGFRNGLGSLFVSCELKQTTKQVIERHPAMFFRAVLQDYKDEIKSQGRSTTFRQG